MKIYLTTIILLFALMFIALPLSSEAKLETGKERIRKQQNSVDIQLQQEVIAELQALKKLQTQTNQHLAIIADEAKKQNQLWQQMLAASASQ